MSRDRITYYRGMIIVKDDRYSYYQVIINGIKSPMCLTTVKAAETAIDTHLKNIGTRNVSGKE